MTMQVKVGLTVTLKIAMLQIDQIKIKLLIMFGCHHKIPVLGQVKSGTDTLGKVHYSVK